MLPVEDWRKLLASLDTSNLVGLPTGPSSAF